MPSIQVPSSKNILLHSEKAQIIAIDEAQFFDDDYLMFVGNLHNKANVLS